MDQTKMKSDKQFKSKFWRKKSTQAQLKILKSLPYQILGGITVKKVQIDQQTTEKWPIKLYIPWGSESNIYLLIREAGLLEIVTKEIKNVSM